MSDAPSGPASWVLQEIFPDDSAGLDIIADVHMELLGFGPMAGLGWRFVRDICYAAHMQDDLLRVVLVTVDGAPAGFVAFTPYSIGFHRSGLSAHWVRAGVAVARALIERPSRTIKLLRALKVLLSRRGETVLGSDPLGEVVCVAVRKPYLAAAFVRRSGLRLSEALARHAAEQLARAGADRMRMIVDADNKPVLMLYHLMGAHFEPYEQAGEPRVHVWFELPKAAQATAAAPSCWSESAPATQPAADTWRAYWERIEDRQAVFRIEARDYARRVRRHFPGAATMRALDFGCGFGHVARELAAHFGTIGIWDASATVRRQARERVGSLANIEFLDLEREPQPPVATFDLILVHSVLQYMSHEEIRAWLARWRSMLARGGRIVLSDLMQPNASGVSELAGYLRFALCNGFFCNAFVSGIAEMGRYFSARKARPLTLVPRATLETWASQAGLSVEWLPENLSHRQTRATAVLCSVSEVPAGAHL